MRRQPEQKLAYKEERKTRSNLVLGKARPLPKHSGRAIRGRDSQSGRMETILKEDYKKTVQRSSKHTSKGKELGAFFGWGWKKGKEVTNKETRKKKSGREGEEGGPTLPK